MTSSIRFIQMAVLIYQTADWMMQYPNFSSRMRTTHFCFILAWTYFYKVFNIKEEETLLHILLSCTGTNGIRKMFNEKLLTNKDLKENWGMSNIK